MALYNRILGNFQLSLHTDNFSRMKKIMSFSLKFVVQNDVFYRINAVYARVFDWFLILFINVYFPMA